MRAPTGSAPTAATQRCAIAASTAHAWGGGRLAHCTDAPPAWVRCHCLPLPMHGVHRSSSAACVDLVVNSTRCEVSWITTSQQICSKSMTHDLWRGTRDRKVYSGIKSQSFRGWCTGAFVLCPHQDAAHWNVALNIYLLRGRTVSRAFSIPGYGV